MAKRWVLVAALLAIVGPAAARAEGHAFCSGKRLTGDNYAFKYRKFRNQLDKDVESGKARTVFEAAVFAGKQEPQGESELCRWNRFFFLDSVIYFQQTKELGARGRADRLQMLAWRDHLYREWLDSLQYRVHTGYTEWENLNLRGEPLSRFIARGSSIFGFLEKASSVFNHRPRRGIDRVVYDLLEAKTPFSSVMPTLALEAVNDPATRQAVACVRDSLKAAGCPSEDLFTTAKGCAQTAGAADPEETAFIILGVLGSQRMYLVRDFKGWLEQNVDRETFESRMSALEAGSEIYFRSETKANRCGHEIMYPRVAADQAKSYKAYHFWSVAYLSRLLVRQGFERQAAVTAAVKPARKYKRMIQFPGVLYNLVLGEHLTSGTVGDYSDVIEEQKLGARFGAGLLE